MSQIGIVVHVYSAVLPHYAAMLNIQFRALVEHTPQDIDVELAVACAEQRYDQPTWDAICEVLPIQRKNVRINPVPMDRGELFRRAIFRHKMSQESKADVLWYADSDYRVADGTLEAICAQVQRDTPLCFPRSYYIHNDHATGDRAITSGAFDPSEFHQRAAKLAIGGIQIIGADVAKRVGYLGGRRSKWQRPENPEIPFRCFRDDSTWRRREFPGGGRPIDVPNLYRLRHSLGAKGSPGPGQISVDAK